MSDKQGIISSVYFDKSGYGSKKITLADAKEKDKSITMNDIDKFFKDNVEQKKQLKGYNSFVAPHANYEYQIDLFFINDLPDQKFKVGMICIDIFTKYMVVVPISSKKEGDVAAGLLECLHKMKATPKIIYTDDEGALQTEAMKTYFNEKNIRHTITRTHAWFAERAIKTFKDALYKRIDNNKNENNVQWTEFIYEILLTYNNKLVHSSHGMTPSDARKKSNEIDVKLQLLSHRKHNRKYPLLEIGDKVKNYRKKKLGEKERTSTWSENSYELEGISKSHDQHFFKLNGLSRQYMRHELLKV